MDELVRMAVAARARGYAPYSGFLVGAAVRTVAGSAFAGCNMENAAYPEGVCAEAGALSAMVLGGGGRVVELVVAGRGVVTPCGGCRQKLWEFAGADAVVRMVDEAGVEVRRISSGGVAAACVRTGEFGLISAYSGGAGRVFAGCGGARAAEDRDLRAIWAVGAGAVERGDRGVGGDAAGRGLVGDLSGGCEDDGGVYDLDRQSDALSRGVGR